MLNIFLKLILTLTMFTTLPVMGQWEVFDYGVDIGRETENDITLKAALGRANDPFIKYNVTSNAWEFSNNGVKTQPFSTVTQKLKNYPKVKPTLALHFARDKKLDERITFERASKRSCINEFGLIYYLEDDEPCFDHDPETLESKGLLIEESRTNLLTHSNQFDNGVWTKNRVNIQQGAGTGPFGSLTAWRVIDTTENNTHDLRYSFTPTGNTTYTMTVFVKYDEGSPIEHAQVQIGNFSQQVASNTIVINLKTGIFTATDYSRTRVRPVNGGYLVSSTVTTIATPTINLLPIVYLHNGTSSTYAGTGTGSILVSDFQLEVGSFSTSTISSTETFTSRASIATYIDQDGLIKTAAIDEERLSYNPENLNVPPKLLLEGAKTNLAPYSEDLENPTQVPINITVTDGVIASPIVGVMAPLLEATSSSDVHCSRTLLTIPSEGVYTASVFVKGINNGTTTRIYINDNSNSANHATSGIFDPFTKTWLSNMTHNGTGWQALGRGFHEFKDGWFRIWFTLVAPAGATQFRNYVARGTIVNYTGTSSDRLYATGLQFEPDYLSSYIPTTASTATRAEDIYTSTTTTRAEDQASITGANFSSWYNQNEGTFVVKANPHYQPNSRHFFSVSDGTVQNRIRINATSEGRVNGFITTSNVGQMNEGFAGTSVSDTFFSAGISYKQNDSAISVNGLTPFSDSSVLIPNVNRLNILCSETGFTVYNGWLSNLRYFPKRLTNEELQTTSDPEVNDFLWAVGQ